MRNKPQTMMVTDSLELSGSHEVIGAQKPHILLTIYGMENHYEFLTAEEARKGAERLNNLADWLEEKLKEEDARP